MSRIAALARVALVAVAAVSCSSNTSGSSEPGSTVSMLPDDPTKPYVISIIENHFHDAHPTLPIRPGRDVIFRHQGSALHDVSIVGSTSIMFSHDVAPGQDVTIPNASSFLGGPGQYVFYCKYHLDLGMAGIIVIG